MLHGLPLSRLAALTPLQMPSLPQKRPSLNPLDIPNPPSPPQVIGAIDGSGRIKLVDRNDPAAAPSVDLDLDQVCECLCVCVCVCVCFQGWALQAARCQSALPCFGWTGTTPLRQAVDLDLDQVGGAGLPNKRGGFSPTRVVCRVQGV